jgi:hypothetical protein
MTDRPGDLLQTSNRSNYTTVGLAANLSGLLPGTVKEKIYPSKVPDQLSIQLHKRSVALQTVWINSYITEGLIVWFHGCVQRRCVCSSRWHA